MPNHSGRPSIEVRNLSTSSLVGEALHTNEQSLAITLDSIGDSVISTDRGGHIIRINRVAQILTGWSLVEARGRRLSEVFRIIDGENGAEMSDSFEAAMLSGIVTNLAPNTALVSRTGQHFLIEGSVSLIRDTEKSTPSGLVLVFRDITEKCKLEVEFQQAKKLETIGRLAGGVAHDFNNLLAGIMGYGEMLFLELETDPRLQGFVRSILEAAQRAAKLTSQLLAFSRKGKIVSQPVDLHACIASAMAMLRSTTDKRISIVTQLNASSVTVMGDPTVLEAALLNLGLNARDATPVGGVISIETNTVRLERDFISSDSLSISPGEYVEISISDTGSGMSEEVKGHLFEPFFTTKELGRGTGLGLSSVYGTIKEHHGAISVKSNLDQGTSFKLYLPVCKLLVAEMQEETAQVFRGSGCILLVDDERVVRETTSAMLEAIGYEVLLAENGVDALDIYKREAKRIELVILDVVMPRLSGPDTFIGLKNIDKGVNVIFSSGYTFDNGANELLSTGAFGFLQKPFLRNDLYRVIQESLSSSQSREQVVST